MSMLACELMNAEHHRTHAIIYGGHDAKVCALGERALAFWLVGRVDEAVEHGRAAIEWADDLSHVGSRVHAFDYALVLHSFRRDAVEVSRWAEHARSVRNGAAPARPSRQGRVLSRMGAGSSRRSRGRHGRDAKGTGFGAGRGHARGFPSVLRNACRGMRTGTLPREGLAAMAEGFAQAAHRGIVYWNAELHRRHGELLLASGCDAAEVADCFRKAIACARAQGARSLELRAAVSLSRLHRANGEPAYGRLDPSSGV